MSKYYDEVFDALNDRLLEEYKKAQLPNVHADEIEWDGDKDDEEAKIYTWKGECKHFGEITIVADYNDLKNVEVSFTSEKQPIKKKVVAVKKTGEDRDNCLQFFKGVHEDFIVGLQECEHNTFRWVTLTNRLEPDCPVNKNIEIVIFGNERHG